MAKRTVATTDLLKWLRRAPQPKYVLADDKRVDVPKTHAPWPQLADTLTALDPSKITCCADDGAILRARPFGDGHDDDDDDGPSVDNSITLKNTGAVLGVFAKLIAEGYEKGSVSSQPLLNNAMSFIERQGQQITRLDGIIDRLRQHNAKLQAEVIALSGQQHTDPDPEGNGIINALVAGVLQGQQQAAAAPAAPEKLPNGRGQPRRAK